MTEPVPPPRRVPPRTIAIIVMCAATLAAAIAHRLQTPGRATLTVEAIEGGVPLSELATAPATAVPPFALTRSDGVAVSEADLRGRTTLMFFGFTHCPDVCPTALATYRQVRTLLPPAAQARAQLWFVSVDPDNDTPERLRDYVAAIDPHIVALRGEVAAVRALATPLGVSFGAAYAWPATASSGATAVATGAHAGHAGHAGAGSGAPQPATTAAPIAHTTAILLIDPDGRVRRAFAPPYDASNIATAVATLAVP